MRRRHQSALVVTEEPDVAVLEERPSTFLPGRAPHRLLADPRATPTWRRVRKAVLLRDRFVCRQCGKPASDVDHRTELVDGGAPFDPENLQALCAACHDAKSSDSRYRRSLRAAISWGRMALCPWCSGTGRCPFCPESAHACSGCLGVRLVPERSALTLEIPSQLVLAEVSSLAWAGAVPRPD